MYSNIMVPVSVDDARDLAAAVEAAKRLASEGARITFVHVLEAMPIYIAEVIPAETLADRRAFAARKIEEISAGVENAHSIILDSAAGRTLTGWARENGVDCIVIASHRPDFTDIFLGSTAAWVVRHAACAVHVIR